jgi:Spy/CpxP family protein refolding chaperone
MERALGAQGSQGRWWNNPKMVADLKLTDEQRKSMDEIFYHHREKLVDLRGAVQKAELEMEPLMRDDKPNEKQIAEQIDKVAQARAELEKANAHFLFELRGKLTPEQWTQVQAIRTNRQQGQRGWQQRGGQGRDGQGQGRQYQYRNRQFRQQAPPPPPQSPAPASAPQGVGPQSRVDGGAGPEESGDIGDGTLL